jgi:hypothetical protein
VALRYFVYISDPKVDMLLSQIEPDAKKKLATEFSVDLKVFAAKRSTEHGRGEDRIARLEAVIKFLNENGYVGPIDEPRGYVGDTLPMRWGPHQDEPDLVYFGGSTERTIVGLGGSVSNVIGSPPAHSAAMSQSATPALVASLEARMDAGLDDVEAGEGAGKGRSLDDQQQALGAAHIATADLRGPVQSLEFLAKTLIRGPSPFPQRDQFDDMSVLLGSPLYVASLD